MQVIHQSFTPKIVLSSYNGGCYADYVTFGATGITNKNITSYSFSRSLENLVGSFNFSFKESTGNSLSASIGMESENVLDKIRMLDLVKIYEFDKLVFIGIVIDVSHSASSGNFQKRVSVNGKSIEYLFELLQISLDVTAMSFAQKEALNITLVNELNKKDNTEGIDISEGVKIAFDNFKSILNNYKKVSTVQILEMMKAVYESDDISSFLDCAKIKFCYPISSNLYQDRTVKFPDFLRNILPTPVYEIYGKITNDRPRLNIRQVPFTNSDWKNLACYRVPPELLTSYSFSKSCAEVYTEFLTYVEGSLIEPGYYKKLTGSDKAYDSQCINEEKAAIYGYKPLEVTFIGFYSGKNKDDETNTNNTLKERIAELNKKLKDWFGRLDEMYSGSISFVNAEYGDKKTGIGERVMVGSNEFYITGEKHDWSYAATPTVTYTVDRGGKYSANGDFSECKNISKVMGEFEKA